MQTFVHLTKKKILLEWNRSCWRHGWYFVLIYSIDWGQFKTWAVRDMIINIVSLHFYGKGLVAPRLGAFNALHWSARMVKRNKWDQTKMNKPLRDGHGHHIHMSIRQRVCPFCLISFDLAWLLLSDKIYFYFLRSINSSCNYYFPAC